MRIVVGCLVTPFAAAAAMFVAALAAEPWLSGGKPADRFDQPASMAIGVWFLAVFVLAIAVPMVLWMTKRGPIPLRRVLLLGAVLGVLPIAASVFISSIVAARSSGPIPLPMTVSSPILMTTFGLFVGVCSAAAFWVVALRNHVADGIQT
jgi:hypothetical protein